MLTPVFTLYSEDVVRTAKVRPAKVGYISIVWNFVVHRLPILYPKLLPLGSNFRSILFQVYLEHMKSRTHFYTPLSCNFCAKVLEGL